MRNIVAVAGTLKFPLLIMLQETGDKFGPIVEKNIYQAVTLCLYSDHGTIF